LHLDEKTTTDVILISITHLLDIDTIAQFNAIIKNGFDILLSEKG
jgi:hypothetical protein